MGVKAQGNRRLEQEGQEGLGGCAGENKGAVHNVGTGTEAGTWGLLGAGTGAWLPSWHVWWS